MALQLGFDDLLAAAMPSQASQTGPALQLQANSPAPSVENEAASRPWLCIFLPDLPLEALLARSLQEQPSVVSENDRGRALVVTANAAALEAGIKPGMTVASAHALHDTLVVLERSVKKEQQRLVELADWLYNFSSQVSLQPPNQLLVEIAGSTELFGGEQELLQQISAGLEQRSHRCNLAVAETPTAARWLCRYGRELSTQSANGRSLHQRLGVLPIEALSNEANIKQLSQLGVSTLADVMRLPRAGLARRFGPKLLEALDRAKGLRPEPLQNHQPALQFEELIELDAELANLQQFWPLVQKLLAQLTRFAQEHDRCFQQLQLRLQHSDRCNDEDDEAATRNIPPESLITLRLLRPGNHLPRVEALLHSQLESTALPAPIRALSLTVKHFMFWPQTTMDAIGASASSEGRNSEAHEEWIDTLERLQLRLGSARVLSLRINNDHRPEKAWRYGPATVAPNSGHSSHLQQPMRVDQESPSEKQHRPNWLLQKPKPLGRTQLAGLQLISRPERIQAGWWSHDPAERDYFIARNSDGQRLWIFRNETGWFCHGLFS